jgi:hypothetical protein
MVSGPDASSGRCAMEIRLVTACLQQCIATSHRLPRVGFGQGPLGSCPVLWRRDEGRLDVTDGDRRGIRPVRRSGPA